MMTPIYKQIVSDVETKLLENGIAVAKKCQIEVNEEGLIQALTNARKFYDEGYADGQRDAGRRGELGEKAEYAFGAIAWYNGHSEWLCELADKLDSKENGFVSAPDDMEWLTDRHALWMMLVGMFGDWGTSIRSGWIEYKKAAAAFIREATEEYRDAIEEEAEQA
jgi:hypothetical protein